MCPSLCPCVAPGQGMCSVPKAAPAPVPVLGPVGGHGGPMGQPARLLADMKRREHDQAAWIGRAQAGAVAMATDILDTAGS